MFLIASLHVVICLLWFHSGGDVHPLVSLFASNTHYGSLRFFPFQTLGFVAWIIFMLMAFTSHDFWLHFLSPRVWKVLHMLVYLAYSLIVMHVMLGIIQLEDSPVIFLMIMTGLLALCTLHIIAGYKEWKIDHTILAANNDWLYLCEVDDIAESRAKIIVVNDERVAVFKYDGLLSAVHNVCKHQNGPLGEGRVIKGCITCPWHGYQYRPEDGSAPPPFNERVATYRLKLEGEKIYIHTAALPEGTMVEALSIKGIQSKSVDSASEGFFIGWSNENKTSLFSFTRNFALAFVFVGLLFGSLFTLAQRHIADSSFDYDHLKEFKGQMVLKPFPALRVLTGRDISGNPLIATFPLVNAEKFGADEIVKSYLSQNKADAVGVKITGAVIKRDSVRAIELSDGAASVKVLNAAHTMPPAKLTMIGDTILRGQIIDPKCYLGAMNPGEGKPHRSCAIRCISGGIMPMLAYRSNGRMKYAVLLGSAGERINKEVLDYVAEPVAIKGRLYTFDDWQVLYIDPKVGITRQ
jgi:nitrite reductase/ring-hydroxylating ferredoxin subunit